MSATGKNLRTGALLAGTCTAIYFYTIHHLKQVAPGDLDKMVRNSTPFPPPRSVLTPQSPRRPRFRCRRPKRRASACNRRRRRAPTTPRPPSNGHDCQSMSPRNALCIFPSASRISLRILSTRARASSISYKQSARALPACPRAR